MEDDPTQAHEAYNDKIKSHLNVAERERPENFATIGSSETQI